MGDTPIMTAAGNERTGPRYGILGGTFDPPHLGHLVLAQEVLAQLRLDKVWFVPTGSPPHKPNRRISSAADRREMVERAIAGNEQFALSAVELDRDGPSYSADTVCLLRRQWGENVFMCFILGWDMLTYLPQWHQPERVIATADRIAATHRPGFASAAPDEIAQLSRGLPGLAAKLTIVSIPQLEVSSSEIRRRVASGVPIRYLVSDSVRSYIEERGLYRSTTSALRGAEQ